MFATNKEQTDHIALYLADSKLGFSYNSGSGSALLRSSTDFVDGEWHSVGFSRFPCCEFNCFTVEWFTGVGNT